MIPVFLVIVVRAIEKDDDVNEYMRFHYVVSDDEELEVPRHVGLRSFVQLHG